jgi:hypothetical protein
VNIIETSIKSDNEKMFLLLVVDGWLLTGGPNGEMDQVNILIDSDSNSNSGYSLDGFGADYLIRAAGNEGKLYNYNIMTFDQSYKSDEFRSNTDWHGWKPVNNGYVASKGNKLEAGINYIAQSQEIGENIKVIFETCDYNGHSDETAILSNDESYVEIAQQSIIEDDIIEQSINVEILKVTLISHEKSVVLTDFKFDNSLNIPYKTIPSLPVTLEPDTQMEIIIQIDTALGKVNDAIHMEIIGAELLSNVPVTITGNGYSGYLSAPPDDIIIDGAFGDWNDIEPIVDDVGEEDLNGNNNIDIIEHRISRSKKDVSFFLKVDGTIMAGAHILNEPLKVIEDKMLNGRENTDRSLSNDPLKSSNLIPKYGYDYAYVFLDSDKNVGTGFNPDYQIGADYMMRIVGQNGKVLFKELFKFDSREDPDDFDVTWKKIDDIPAACDSSRLETQFSNDLLKINENTDFHYQILLTDWSKNQDIIYDPLLGDLGESGSMLITKMNKNTDHLNPPLNQITDQVSNTRANIPAGDQGGGNLIPNDGDVLTGYYFNVDKFEVAAGVTVYLQNTTLIIIQAQHIYINGTILGNNNGTTGGTAGAIATNGGAGGGSATGGNGSGGTGSGTGAGGGGGGGGYGGTGGAGGAGGTGGAGGAGGPIFGSTTSMTITTGFAGGGGGGGQHCAGGTGGAGGGGIWLHGVNNVSISGTVTVDGGNGVNGISTATNNEHGGGGGGGGSGGGILIKLDSATNALVISGTLSADGGAGGAGGAGGGGNGQGGGGGGGGGGGRIKIFYNSTFTNTSTITVNGGALGAAGGGKNGVAGNAGVAGSVHIVPEFELLAIPMILTLLLILIFRKKYGKMTKNSNKESFVVKEVIH